MLRSLHIRAMLSVLMLLFQASCATLPGGDTPAEKRHAIDALDAEMITRFASTVQDGQKRISTASGYGVFKLSLTKIPLIGAGGGYGVVVDHLEEERTYLRVRRVELGSGAGVLKLYAVVLFQDAELVKDFVTGKIVLSAAAAASAGDGSAGYDGEPLTVEREGYQVYLFSESGAAATATVRLLWVTVDRELN